MRSILYAKTGKFIMYFHLERAQFPGYDDARVGIAVADKPTGPYKFVRSLNPTPGTHPVNASEEEKTLAALERSKKEWRVSLAPSEEGRRALIYPACIEKGQDSRDMTLYVDDDATAYLIHSSERNSTLHFCELTQDYLDFTGRWWRVAEKDWTEAPAVCKKNGWYYLIGSGCTGWAPNAARYYRARKITGPWERRGNPCRGVNTVNAIDPELTWGAQSNYILEVSPDLHIAMFDIWNPSNQSDSRLVWLPVSFGDGEMSILWRDVWCNSDAQEDAVDPRVRTYVYPKRIVWCTPSERRGDGWEARSRVEKPELLLDRKFGQVCEGRFGTQNGCTMANRGEPPGMILDFGQELHGSVQLGMSPGGTAGVRLRLRFGESVSETMSTIGDGKHATNDHAMRDIELPVPQFGSIEIGNTGFRFLRIDLLSGGEAGFEFVRAVSLMRPMVRIGNFRSSDERLNRVFETAVRTVHLCCQDYLWDGIKRDRLVWMGDVHPEAMAILNVFGAAGIIQESLDYMAATSPPGHWMHGMPTYTLWWIRNVAEWYRYTGDAGYVRRHAAYLEKTFDHVLSGMKGGKWLAGNFLDWPTLHNPGACDAGTQGLALMTARDVVLLAEAIGLSGLVEKAKGMEAELLKLKPDPNGAKSAAAMLALSGLRDPKDMFAEVLGVNGHKGVSTFYGYYMIEGMSAAGENQRALDTVRDYWGGMLDMGATSFREDFDLVWTNNAYRIDEMPTAGKKDVHGDFGQFCYPGFRHSLCHGWAGGPVSWCIKHVLGIRPVGVGCKTVEVKPFLGDLSWAEGAMALPDGRAVKVRVEKLFDGTLKTDVEAPDGIRIVR